MRPARAVAVATLALAAAFPAVAPAGAVSGADGPTLSLVWDGATRRSVEQSFVGVPVAVPGDRERRGVTVRNDGPTGGTLEAWVTRVDLVGTTGGPDDGFYDDLRLGWTTASESAGASFRRLGDAGDTLILRTHLARGEATRVEIAYELPAAATSGNRAGAGDRAASFVVRFRISGDTEPASPAPHPTPGGTPRPSTTPAPQASGVPGPQEPGSGRPPMSEVSSADSEVTRALAVTGVDVLRAALAAVVGIGLGSILLGAARRRRDVQHPIGSGSAPSAG